MQKPDMSWTDSFIWQLMHQLGGFWHINADFMCSGYVFPLMQFWWVYALVAAGAFIGLYPAAQAKGTKSIYKLLAKCSFWPLMLVAFAVRNVSERNK